MLTWPGLQPGQTTFVPKPRSPDRARDLNHHYTTGCDFSGEVS
jgi:hypothetical protein